MSRSLQNISQTGSRWRVLAADDDPILRELMREKIGAEFEVECVEDGEQAWERLRNGAFDIAIIDLGMPRLDGFGLIRYLRQTPKTVDMPIIVATSRGDNEAIEQAFQSGATSFVTKPFNWSLFTHQIRFVLKQGDSEITLRSRVRDLENKSQEMDFLLRNIEVLANKRDDPGHGAAASDISGRLLQDLFYLTRLVRGGNHDHQQAARFSINDLFDDCMAHEGIRASVKSVKLMTRPTLEQGTIKASRRQLADALSRLVRNAVTASPPGGTVEIMAHKQTDNSLVLTVRDNGPGIEAVDLDTCYGSLAQLRITCESGEKMPGLSLHIVRKVAENNGGRLIIQSANGSGTVAGIWLPAERVQFEQFEQSA